MDERAIRDLLAQGGLDPSVAILDDAEGLLDIPRYEALTNPRQTQQLVGELAGRISSTPPDALLVWEHVIDAVLGYELGRVLEVPVVRCYDADGLVAHVGSVPARGRLAAVTDVVRRPAALRAMSSFAAQQGASLDVVAVLVSTGQEVATLERRAELIALTQATVTPRGERSA